MFGFASSDATGATVGETLGKGVTVIGYGGARPWPYAGYPHEMEAEALREATAGRLKPTIGQRFPWIGPSKPTPPSSLAPRWAKLCSSRKWESEMPIRKVDDPSERRNIPVQRFLTRKDQLWAHGPKGRLSRRWRYTP